MPKPPQGQQSQTKPNKGQTNTRATSREIQRKETRQLPRSPGQAFLSSETLQIQYNTTRRLILASTPITLHHTISLFIIIYHNLPRLSHLPLPILYQLCTQRMSTADDQRRAGTEGKTTHPPPRPMESRGLATPHRARLTVHSRRGRSVSQIDRQPGFGVRLGPATCEREGEMARGGDTVIGTHLIRGEIEM